MIFTFSNFDKGFDSIFHGRPIDVHQWASRIPSPDMELAKLYDPMLKSLWAVGSGTYQQGMSYIGSLYTYNAVTAIRIAIGKMASVVGFLKTEFNAISNMFKEEADKIQFVFNALNSIINSEYFQQGLDALGAIPIVGWIIKIIVKVAEGIYKLINFIVKNKIENARKQLTGQPWIPLVEFNKEADENITKYCMERIAIGEAEYLFLPGHYYEKLEDFNIRREKRTGSDKQPLEKTDFFNLTSLNAGGGLGFIPGGVNIAGPMRFPTGACAEVFNAGDLYPSAANLATSMYQIIQKEGPALYSLNTDKVASKWKTTISKLLEYAEQSIKLGWTCSPTGEFNSNTYTCNKDSLRLFNSDDCKRDGQIGNKAKIPSSFNGHYGAFRTLIGDLFFAGNVISTINGKTKYFDPDQSTPVKALKILKERQYAVIDSLMCMYVDNSTLPNQPTTKGRFPAIKDDNTLNSRWEKNVTAVLNSTDEWKKVVFYDVPDGEIKEILRKKAIKAKLNPDKPGPIDAGLNKVKMPSVLPNPKPPAPSTPQEPKRRGRDDSKSISSGSSSNSNGLLLAGAAALGLFFIKK